MSDWAVDPALAPAPGAEVAEAAVLVDLDLAGRFAQGWPDVGVSRQAVLQRGRVELGVVDGPLAARVVAGAVRSGGADGYIGVDGESVVPQIQVAEARLDAPRFGLRLSAGMLDDPWVSSGEAAWGLPAVALTVSNQLGWIERSDLGLRLSATAPRGLASGAVFVAAGEGLRRRERNDGKSITVVAALSPFASSGHPERLVIAVSGRDGSRGLDPVRDHRAAARVSTRFESVGGGVETVTAWGVDGDGARTPRAASAWVWARPIPAALVFARADVIDEDPGEEGARWGVARGGAGWTVRRDAGEGRLLVGVDVGVAGPAATEVAGASGQGAWGAGWIQLEVRLRGSAALEDR